MEQSNKPKQKKKPGKVIRLTPDLVSIVEAEHEEGETYPETIRRLLGLTGEVRYVLPSDIYESVEDARGVAIIKAVKQKVKKTERPVAVRKV